MFKLKKEDNKKLNKCIRIPEAIVTEIERISKKENISFSSFVIQALEYVLNEKKWNFLNFYEFLWILVDFYKIVNEF